MLFIVRWGPIPLKNLGGTQNKICRGTRRSSNQWLKDRLVVTPQRPHLKNTLHNRVIILDPRMRGTPHKTGIHRNRGTRRIRDTPLNKGIPLKTVTHHKRAILNNMVTLLTKGTHQIRGIQVNSTIEI